MGEIEFNENAFDKGTKQFLEGPGNGDMMTL